MSICSKKNCRRVATQAFDVYNPWPDGKPRDQRHYEVCDKHAAEYWPHFSLVKMTKGEYLERDRAKRIRKELVPR